jgi:hypothetical protein
MQYTCTGYVVPCVAFSGREEAGLLSRRQRESPEAPDVHYFSGELWLPKVDDTGLEPVTPAV